MIIAIEGSYRSGRTQAATALASRLNIPCIQVEQACQAVALYALAGEDGLNATFPEIKPLSDVTDKQIKENLEALKKKRLQIKTETGRVYMDGIDITRLLYRDIVTQSTINVIACYEDAAKEASAILQKAAENVAHCVMEGPFIPVKADLNIWLKADDLIRAHRHQKSAQPLGNDLSAYRALEEVLEMDSYEQGIRERWSIHNGHPDTSINTTYVQSPKQIVRNILDLMVLHR